MDEDSNDERFYGPRSDLEDERPADVVRLTRTLRVGEPFTEADRSVMRAVAAMLPGWAMMFGKQCEIVLHSLENPESSVLAAVHPVISEREVGSPLTSRGLRFIAKLTTTWREKGAVHYIGTGPHGERVKSVFIPVYNDEGRCLGVVSAALNLDAPLRAWFEDLCHVPDAERPPAEEAITYGGSETLFLQRVIANALRDVDRKKTVRQRDKMKHVIELLYRKGVFQRKDAVNMVSARLNITSATVYHHIRELKARDDPSG